MSSKPRALSGLVTGLWRVLAVFAAAPLACELGLEEVIYCRNLGINTASIPNHYLYVQGGVPYVSEQLTARDLSRRRRITPRASWRPPWRPPRRPGAAAAAAKVLASCLRLPLLHSTSCVAAGSVQPPPSGHAAPGAPGRTASAAPADAPKGRRLERPAVAAYGNATGGLWSDHEEIE